MYTCCTLLCILLLCVACYHKYRITLWPVTINTVLPCDPFTTDTVIPTFGTFEVKLVKTGSLNLGISLNGELCL